jgi:hypothetical protein
VPPGEPPGGFAILGPAGAIRMPCTVFPGERVPIQQEGPAGPPRRALGSTCQAYFTRTIRCSAVNGAPPFVGCTLMR